MKMKMKNEIKVGDYSAVLYYCIHHLNQFFVYDFF